MPYEFDRVWCALRRIKSHGITGNDLFNYFHVDKDGFWVSTADMEAFLWSCSEDDLEQLVVAVGEWRHKRRDSL